MSEVNGPLFDPGQDVVTDAKALHTLAHPLRLRLLGLLRVYGPSTATKLAASCGESSGLTSYHLRQLAAAGFVMDANPVDLAGLAQTGGRERWWKAARRSTFAAPPEPDDEAAAAVSGDYLRAVLAANAAAAGAWLSGEHRWSQPWRDAANFSDIPLRLTLAEARRLDEQIAALLAQHRWHDPAQPPGSGDVPAEAVIVRIQYQVFPDADQDPS
jgi:hypothetical protein